MTLDLTTKPYSFRLSRSLQTFQGIISHKEGWLLRIRDSFGYKGWGEVSPISSSERKICEKILAKIGTSPSRQTLEDEMSLYPGPLAFGLGAALAELDCLVGSDSKEDWLRPPKSALLLPSGDSLFPIVDSLVEASNPQLTPITLKWKVAISSDKDEQKTLQMLLSKLPLNCILRIDANGGWNRSRARRWGELVVDEPRIQWLEQPLRADDFSGLWHLVEKFPIALDESLLLDRSLMNIWPGWQIRRPVLEGDPRLLLRQLEGGLERVMISTAFETGIGLRWVHHFAALQQNGPTPTAPGLAPGWCPQGPLFSTNPEVAWQAA